MARGAPKFPAITLLFFAFIFLSGVLRGAVQPRPATYDPTTLSNLNAPMKEAKNMVLKDQKSEDQIVRVQMA